VNTPLGRYAYVIDGPFNGRLVAVPFGQLVIECVLHHVSLHSSFFPIDSYRYDVSCTVASVAVEVPEILPVKAKNYVVIRPRERDDAAITVAEIEKIEPRFFDKFIGGA